MPTSIEAQGVTVEEAIQIALNQLGVTRDRVEIEILHHPRAGFLGLGARRAKVRATVREAFLADGEEYDMSSGERIGRGARGRSRRSRRRRGRRGEGRPEGEQPSARRDERDRRDTRERDSRDAGADVARRTSGREVAREPREREPREGRDTRESRREERSGEPQRDRGRRGSRGRDREAEREAGRGTEGGRAPSAGRGRETRREQPPHPAPRAVAIPAQPAAVTERANAPAAASQVAPAPAREQPLRARRGEEDEAVVPEREPAVRAAAARSLQPRVEELVTELLSRMGFQPRVSSTYDDEDGELVVKVEADAEGLLIGRRGQTLDAIEHVVNRMANVGEVGGETRVAIDVGGYRERRRDTLLELADRLKVRALTQGRRIQVSPMSPRDRRILQSVLGSDDSVHTRVLGTGFYRRVVIFPAGLEEDSLAVEIDDEREVEPSSRADEETT